MMGVALVCNASRHLTARAGDNHAAPSQRPLTAIIFQLCSSAIQAPGKVLVSSELNHMFLRLCGPKSIPLVSPLPAYSPGGILIIILIGSSIHRYCVDYRVSNRKQQASFIVYCGFFRMSKHFNRDSWPLAPHNFAISRLSHGFLDWPSP